MKQMRFISIILTGAIAASLASCSGGGETSSDGKPVLNVLQPHTTEDLNNHAVGKLIEEKTGYHINYETLPQDKPYDKLNLIISGGEAYDVVIMGNRKSTYASYAMGGALTDLGPLLEKYGQNITSKISESSMNEMKIDGKQFGIPNTSAAAVSNGIIIRKDWLDKLGLEMPQTTDEFVNVLKAFKEKDPGNNGAGGSPMALAAGNIYVPNLQGAFGLAADWNDIDGKLTANVTRPEFKEYLKFMRTLYSEGLIDREFATLKSANAKERFTSGKSGVMVLNCFEILSVLNTLNKINPEAEVEYIPLLKNTDGTCGMLCNTNAIDKMIFIPKSAKHPEDAMKWMNAKLEDDLFREYTIGTEGVHYEIKDGAYYPILPVFYDERNISSAYLTGVDEELYPQYWQARIRKDESIYNAWDYLNHSDSHKDNLVESVLESAPYIKEYDDNIQKINSNVQDFMIEVVAGDKDIDAAVDAFIEKWKADGGEEIEKAVNEWYTANK